MARQEVLMEPQSPGSPASPPSPGKLLSPELPEPSPEMSPPDEAPEEETPVNPDRKSSSPSSSSSSSSSRASSAGCVFHVEVAEMGTPLVLEAPDDDGDHTDAGAGTDAKLPGDWASWPEPSSPPKTVDDDPSSSDVGTVSVAPESQTMAKPAVAMDGFNPDRIPASIFQPKTSSSQQEWSIASNESLFSIHGASQSQSDDFYAPSRSHFDYFYDEAMAAGAGAEPNGKLPPLAEVSEHGGGTVPGSAVSDASDGSAAASKAAMAFRRHESGSFGSSSNFSFAFPILAEPSAAKKESMGGQGGYQQLQKEHERSPPTPSERKSQFEEMTTEEERRKRKTGWCWYEECCGRCWFACSWSTCCCCFQWRWNCCSCSCSCPSLCRCSWCL